jgi:8-hydroxy-5-deazaflavin:NADPH oxidoreductase
MHVGIIGAGGIGQAFAGHVVRAGHEVLLSNSRGPQTLAAVVSRLGPRAKAATREAAAQADIVVLAVQWQQLDAALAGLPAWNGRILVDTTNPVLMPEFKFADLGGRSSSEVVASRTPGARVVKVANTLTPELLAADPALASGHRVLFMSGDDAPAKQQVSAMLQQAGFAIVDLGALANGRLHQFPGGPLPGLNLVKLD